MITKLREAALSYPLGGKTRELLQAQATLLEFSIARMSQDKDAEALRSLNGAFARAQNLLWQYPGRAPRPPRRPAEPSFLPRPSRKMHKTNRV